MSRIAPLLNEWFRRRTCWPFWNLNTCWFYSDNICCDLFNRCSFGLHFRLQSNQSYLALQGICLIFYIFKDVESEMIPSIAKILTNMVDNFWKVTLYMWWNIMNKLNFFLDWPIFIVFWCLKFRGVSDAYTIIWTINLNKYCF